VFCIPQVHAHMAQFIRLHLCRLLQLLGLRKQVVLTDMYYYLYKGLGYWAHMIIVADGGRILLFNSNISGPHQGYFPHHPVMIGEKGDQCDQKELLY
jgi:hypothetical protein